MENTTVLLFILVLNHSSAILNVCRDDQLAVNYSDENITCVKCPVCPPGSGATVACGSVVPYNASIDCKPCMQGTFSDSFTSESCKPCSKCKSTEVLDAFCTNVSDTRCSCKACPKGYYRNQTTSQCLPCSQCCGNNLIIKQCANQGLAHTQSCGYQKRNQCLAKCWYDEVTVACKDGKTICLPCPVCMAGLGLTAPCGSIVSEETTVTCQRPLLGETFVSQQGVLKQCNVCPRGHEVLVNCSLDSDTICGNCTDGFYFEELSLSCQECFWCCKNDDTKDVKQCVRQAMSLVKKSDFLPVLLLQGHFPFLSVSQSPTLGQVQDHTNSQEPWRLEDKALVTSLAAVVTFALGCLIFKVRIKRPAASMKQNFMKKTLKGALEKEDVKVQTLKICRPENKVAQQNGSVANCERQELEYPEIVGPGRAVFKRTGVEVHSQDLDKKYMQGLCLQACARESSQACRLDEGELLLSPIMNFVPNSKAETAVKVQIPHSANIILSPKGWFITLKEFYSNHWFTASGTDYFENQRVHMFAVNSNHVEFETSNLSTFAVVGTYDCSVAPVIKRMNTAAFCNEPTAGEAVCVRVYCFDDCEWSYERLMEEEKHKEGKLLTSLESFDFSVSSNQDVEINVQQTDGWNLDQASIPKKFSHQSLRDSFNMLSTPCCALVFHPKSPVEKSFFAVIGVTQSSSKTTMYAGIPVKKNPTVPATSVHLESEENIHNGSLERFAQLEQTIGTKTLFSISEKVLQKVSLTLDMLPKGVGNWRHLGRKLGICEEEIEIFGEAYLDPDGSPSTFLLQRIKQTHPNITTGEFCRILLEMKREDAVKCIATELENVNQQSQ